MTGAGDHTKQNEKGAQWIHVLNWIQCQTACPARSLIPNRRAT
jgi:hypothetical protein